jgi:hypothetical protein
MSRQLAIVVLVCGAYVVAIGTTTTAMLQQTRMRLFFAC